MITGRRIALVGFGAVVACGVVALQPGCSEQNALLLTVRAQKSAALVQVFDLRVLHLNSGQLVLERRNEKVDAADPARDISKPGQELTIALELAAPGNYLVHFVGRPLSGGSELQFALRDYDVDGTTQETLTLLKLVGDADGDGVPACGPPAGITCPPANCNHLDCNDADPTVHPFAPEVCGDGKDNDCSAGCAGKGGSSGDAGCTDRDGDLVPDDLDCAPDDPCRSPKVPEAATVCGAAKTAWSDAFTKACRAKQGAAFKPPLCGDGVDADCDGKDVPCFSDADCDGHAPPADCDDTDDMINPAAPEACDGKDNNCNKVVDEGCVPCDVDGDLHASKANTDPGCSVPKDDPDDYDAGVHPEITKGEPSGAEGGTALGALRRHCSAAAAHANKEGQKQVDVDHDGDGLTAAADGCPSAVCDVDGDGFEGAQCSPPTSRLDCDDADAETFPGAPDRCGDSKAQNCLADVACGCDADGDGFCPPAAQGQPGDCNDKDKAVHPWATELCDGVDNDCDGLVDEGNPDAAGALISTAKPSCNDDKDGECAPASAPLSGVCACSQLTPKGTRDAANRVACAGEDLSAAASPRCFGALQPQPERCGTQDYNCDGQPFKLGETFVALGASCGTDTGACVAGTVTGCDLSKTAPAKVKQVLGPGFNEHWICSAGTVLPKAEICNGIDDDCDGKLTPGGTDLGYQELGETDGDSDGYLGCSKCKASELPTGIKGCNDCDNTKAAVHPGAKEKCNGVDDNCKDGLSDDGADDCSAPYQCCPTVKACVDTSSSTSHCGGCGKPCDTAVADTCSGGACVCGSAKDPCSGGLNCVSGSCDCVAGGLCAGCCEGGVCKAGDTDKDCGAAGATCKDCGGSAECAADGVCCSGCLTAAGACDPGTSVSACGKDGGACTACTGSGSCGDAICSGGSCGIDAKPDKTTCPQGLCFKGVCCTGCWDGKDCQPGTDDKKCGSGGIDCITCGGGAKCTNQVCKK